MSFRSTDFKSIVYTIPPSGHFYKTLRPGRELHPRIGVLQTPALLLGYLAGFILILLYSSPIFNFVKSSSTLSAFDMFFSPAKIILGIGRIFRVLFILCWRS